MLLGTPGFSVWNEWSDCSKICGNGQKTRTRTCVENCDNVDSNELIDTEICNDRNCELMILSLLPDNRLSVRSSKIFHVEFMD